MDSCTQVFFDFSTTLRTLLRSPPSIDFTEELSSFPTHILDDSSKLSEPSIKHVFSKHSFSCRAVVQVFHEDHITSVAKRMSLFVMKVFPRVVNFVVETGNFKTLSLVILRPLLLSRKPALQQFQLALQTFKKLRRLYENTVTGCQKLLQPDINPNGMTVRSWVRNADITLQGDRCIPIVSFPQDSDLLDHKSCWDGAMQVNRDCSYLGQLDVQIRYWILLKLGEQQRLELPELLKSWKTKPSFLKVFPSPMQLLDGLLENLRRNFTQSRKLFLSFWQVIQLLNFSGKLQVGREDVLFLKRASIYQTLTAGAPIFYLSKCVVIRSSTDFHPLNELLLLSDIWINSVAMCKRQHSSIILDLLVSSAALNVKRKGIELLLLTAFHPPLNYRRYDARRLATASLSLCSI